MLFFFFSSRRRHTRCGRDWSSDVCSSDLSALTDLVERGLVRVLDLLIVRKDADGSFEAFELPDLDDSEVGELRAFEKNVAELLAEDDVAAIAEAIAPGSVAGVLVWENSWAAPFASAIRRAGGQLVATGRIPIQAILAAIEEDQADREGA